MLLLVGWVIAKPRTMPACAYLIDDDGSGEQGLDADVEPLGACD
jgi:hypothetical protein